ncbi:hypothetical protein PITC_032660 [Penicillium italicum]|uniref:Uncharacterized protein n=1 Tax=Penicillium italicum TaxID=40296 RepID=A0A0A2LGW4_PENIT|nr:hypothetical protein PITC_032660 [Penicillium italicum]
MADPGLFYATGFMVMLYHMFTLSPVPSPQSPVEILVHDAFTLIL